MQLCYSCLLLHADHHRSTHIHTRWRFGHRGSEPLTCSLCACVYKYAYVFVCVLHCLCKKCFIISPVILFRFIYYKDSVPFCYFNLSQFLFDMPFFVYLNEIASSSMEVREVCCLYIIMHGIRLLTLFVKVFPSLYIYIHCFDSNRHFIRLL